jgi:glycosyltransferase involved in cell wall biosynthesis
MSNELNIVLLAYNEADTIAAELRTWNSEVLSKIPGSKIIVGEDGSSDGTTEIIQALSLEMPLIHVHSKSRRGYIRAFYSCMQETDSEYVFFADTGLKFNLDDFWKLYDQRKEFDFIAAHRTPRSDPRYRRIMTRIYNLCLRVYFRMPQIFDADSGFRLYNRLVVDEILSIKPIFKDLLSSELTVRLLHKEFQYLEIDIAYEGRDGTSKGLPPRKIVGKALKVLRSFRSLKRSFKQPITV